MGVSIKYHKNFFMADLVFFVTSLDFRSLFAQIEEGAINKWRLREGKKKSWIF